MLEVIRSVGALPGEVGAGSPSGIASKNELGAGGRSKGIGHGSSEAARRRAFLASILCIALAVPALAGQTLEGGWWVVLGASPAPDSTGIDFPAARRAAAAARRCGVETMGDFSAKFEGFAPDLYVTIAGGYRTRAEAEAARIKLCPCVPDAYLRRGAYAGE